MSRHEIGLDIVGGDSMKRAGHLPRRMLLLAALNGAAALGLAACGGAAAVTASTAASTATSAASSSATAKAATTQAASITATEAATSSATAAATTTSAAASAAATASVSAPGKAQVAMQFEHFFTDTLWTQGFQPIVALFEERYPAIKWDGLAVGYGDMLTKLITLSAGGVPPDGTSSSSTWVNQAAVQGLLQPVDDRISKEKDPTAGWIADIFPARQQNYTINGKQYGLAIDMGTSAVYYNKDLFDAAGLAYPKPGWTWNDLWGMAVKLTQQKGDHKQYGFNYSTDLHWLYPIYGGLGGTYFDKPLTKATFDAPGSEQALQTLLDARVKTNVTPYGDGLKTVQAQANKKQPFTLGFYGMEHAWIGLIAYLEDKGAPVKNWDVAPIPEGPDQVQIVGGQGFSIVAGAKHPDEAWDWNTFMVSDDVQKMLGVNGVWFPGRKSMAKFGQPADGKPSRFVEAFYDPVSTGGFSPWWYVAQWQDWQKVINDGLAPAWNGQASASDVAAKITPTLDNLLQQRTK